MKLREGSVVDLIVQSVQDFGLLVTYGDEDGVILVTNVYWDCDGAQAKMLQAFKPGQQVRAKVLATTSQRFSASIKDLYPEDDPWRDPGVWPKGSIHQGTINLIFDFGGALINISNGVEVFVETLRPETTVGDRVNVVIKSVDADKKKIDAELA